MSKMPEVHPHATQELICPVLGALVNEGKVTLNADGTMPLEQLRRSWRELGLSAPMRALLMGLGYVGTSPLDLFHNVRNDHLNALDLRGGPLQHPADSGILTSGFFDEAAFEALASHAQSGVMTVDAFSRAIATNVKRDLQPGHVLDTVLRGLHASVTEFAGLVALFGTRHRETGEYGISVEVLRALYRDKRLPMSRGATVRDAVQLQARMTLKVDAELAAAARQALTPTKPR